MLFLRALGVYYKIALKKGYTSLFSHQSWTSVGGFLFDSAFIMSCIYFCWLMTEYKVYGVRVDLRRKKSLRGVETILWPSMNHTREPLFPPLLLWGADSRSGHGWHANAARQMFTAWKRLRLGFDVGPGGNRGVPWCLWNSAWENNPLLQRGFQHSKAIGKGPGGRDSLPVPHALRNREKHSLTFYRTKK